MIQIKKRKNKKKSSENDTERLKKLISDSGMDVDDLLDIEIISEEKDKEGNVLCAGTCISCQSGCERNS